MSMGTFLLHKATTCFKYLCALSFVYTLMYSLIFVNLKYNIHYLNMLLIYRCYLKKFLIFKRYRLNKNNPQRRESLLRSFFSETKNKNRIQKTMPTAISLNLLTFFFLLLISTMNI